MDGSTEYVESEGSQDTDHAVDLKKTLSAINENIASMKSFFERFKDPPMPIQPSGHSSSTGQNQLEKSNDGLPTGHINPTGNVQPTGSEASGPCHF